MKVITRERLCELFSYDPATGNLINKILTGELPPAGMVIDHADRNRANNKWENLRLCNKAQNRANAERNIKSSSGFRGVFYHVSMKKYEAHYRLDGKRIRIGFFDDPRDAASAAFNARREAWGEYAA